MAQRTWHPGKDAQASLSNCRNLIRLVETRLIARPGITRREEPLPIVYIATAGLDPLIGLDDRLMQTPRMIHTTVSGAGAGPQPEALLNELVAGLSRKVKGFPRLRFPHYSLALWLHGLAAGGGHQAPDNPDREVDARFGEFVRTRQIGRMPNGTPLVPIDLLPWYLQILVGTVAKLTSSWLGGRLGIWVMRVASRPPRWAVRHLRATHYLDADGGFRTLTRNFMQRHAPEAPTWLDQDHVDQFLVDAFMEDLRRAYRSWSISGLLRRRTAHPVVLMKDAGDGSSGLALLKRIAASREAAVGLHEHRRDPLVLVASGDGSSAVSVMVANAQLHDVTNPHTAFQEWTVRRNQVLPSWPWLALKEVGDQSGAGTLDAVGQIPLLKVRRWLVIPTVLTSVAVVLVGVTLHVTVWRCGTTYWESELHRADGTCVGLAPDRYQFFGDVNDLPADPNLAAEFRAVQQRISDRNAQVEQEGDSYSTVVFLEDLSGTSAESYRTVLEELRGLEIAQAQAYAANQPIRLLLANGGENMDRGERAAESIVDQARRDPSLIGVIGLGISREGTRLAMLALAADGIPMVGTQLTATDLANTTTPYYHQVAPTNEDEAKVAAQYIKVGFAAKKVYVVGPDDPKDLYTADLREQVAMAVEERGLEVAPVAYAVKTGTGGYTAHDVGGDMCKIEEDAAVFYAGRATQLREFLAGMRAQCEQNYPNVISGDDATRFVLADGLARFPGLNLYYMSFASNVSAGNWCDSGAENQAFYNEYADRDYPCIDSRDGAAALTYDSLGVMAQGIANAPTGSSGRPTSDAVLAGINEVSTSGKGPYAGASGAVDFGPDGSSVPVNKALLLLKGRGGDTPTLEMMCGTLSMSLKPRSDVPCP